MPAAQQCAPGVSTALLDAVCPLVTEPGEEEDRPRTYRRHHETPLHRAERSPSEAPDSLRDGGDVQSSLHRRPELGHLDANLVQPLLKQLWRPLALDAPTDTSISTWSRRQGRGGSSRSERMRFAFAAHEPGVGQEPVSRSSRKGRLPLDDVMRLLLPDSAAASDKSDMRDFLHACGAVHGDDVDYGHLSDCLLRAGDPGATVASR
eukprot:TRINITY_DN7257_c0_g1_i2.p1 TRINITY_DN7257_c0_g1~~TRINITY_DN7257_c0_g1_i2.p1  ORF type:complete len:220 (+),score=40.14 TRINITY_DN7257_c0_g1_i2:45-662(+)